MSCERDFEMVVDYFGDPEMDPSLDSYQYVPSWEFSGFRASGLGV